ncbi:MAG: OmpA family protein, partial [Oricola sp.]|nr:OmpA family protein [Oricola sp.]
MRLKMTLLAAVSVVAFAPAAQAYEGLYGAIGAGLSYMQDDRDINNESGSGPFVFDTGVDYDPGIGVYAAIGYDYQGPLRGEIEFSYRANDIVDIDMDGPGFSGIPEGSISGDTTSLAIMFNALYDFESFGAVTPYIGAGIGVANIDHDISGSVSPGLPTDPLSFDYASSEWGLAYQAIAGLGFALAEGLDLDISYRYFSTKKDTYSGVISGVASEFEAAYNTHTLFAGLRWSLGSAPEAAPVVEYKDCWDGSSVPVSASCPPAPVEDTAADLDPIQFTVYFDYDKSNLTPQASTLVQEAASRALENDIETVVVAGNTDTSGGSAYNQALSERRARVVRDALIANGVAASAIRVEAFGETNLAKPTADGVREPLNRRSDVV